MTALELADAVEPLVLTSFHETQYIGRNAADMLRTQHALIEDLQKALREVPNTQLHYADHIRRQHEAIKQLREALSEIAKTSWVDASLDPQRPRHIAHQALKDTEEFL